MKIELKNLKHYPSMSEETTCFQASVYIDGKKAGDVKNDGHGGAHYFYPFGLAEKLNSYGATLPEITQDLGEYGKAVS